MNIEYDQCVKDFEAHYGKRPKEEKYVKYSEYWDAQLIQWSVAWQAGANYAISRVERLLSNKLNKDD